MFVRNNLQVPDYLNFVDLLRLFMEPGNGYYGCVAAIVIVEIFGLLNLLIYSTLFATRAASLSQRK